MLVVLRDYGVGSDASKLGQDCKMTDGLGLLNIRERVESIEGCFDISSVPGYRTIGAISAPPG